ncbi:hypothetical protein BpHYR1_035960 [Brachionus plicatilis]|uniref:Uncharacterized protein n=1 Tax=Brachionus plicatilis TaxID=10195 RepID=A0A3M7Q9G9_BRAPC|nr:hypothetical protein BpHYR1_035960 [Brachionus plicatilis]
MTFQKIFSFCLFSIIKVDNVTLFDERLSKWSANGLSIITNITIHAT